GPGWFSAGCKGWAVAAIRWTCRLLRSFWSIYFLSGSSLLNDHRSTWPIGRVGCRAAYKRFWRATGGSMGLLTLWPCAHVWADSGLVSRLTTSCAPFLYRQTQTSVLLASYTAQ